MNSGFPIPDVQSTPDTRRIAIQQVGVKGVRYPVRIVADSEAQSTVAIWNMYVQLPAEKKGTHMSRFVELLESTEMSDPLDMSRLRSITASMLHLLSATEGRIELAFPFFVLKTAPASGTQSLMDYDVALSCEIRDGATRVTQKVTVPVTSLCPCSREISAYGAHNQRSHITVTVTLRRDFPIRELIARIEEQASCELYALLKRPDEKLVTERAYENPKFVEDLVRDVAVVLNADDRIIAYTLEAENFESIHNHSAYARVEHPVRVSR
jgi:GTP cyclohydrolase I